MDLGRTTVRFYESIFAPAYRVLGHKLPPLSLWHLAALEAIESPFITGQGDVRLGDIQSAVQICLTRWPSKPALKPTWLDCVQNLLWNRNRSIVKRHAETLAAHIAHYQIHPEMWREGEEEGKGGPKSPHILLRASALIDLGLSMNVVMNDISPAMASWLICGTNEYRGNSSGMISDRESSIMERMQEGGGDGR